MSSPRALPLAGTLVVLLLLPARNFAANGERLHPAVAEEYHYDTTSAQPKEPAPAPAPVEPAGRTRKRVADPAARIPDATPAQAAPMASATIAPDGTLVLPKMSVTTPKAPLPAPLPQLYIRGPVQNVGPGHAFETAKGRSERLRKKHFTVTEQALGKLTLNSVSGWAAREEAIYYSSEQLNDLAYLLDLSLATGTETPEEQKKLREEYFRLLATKPR